MSNIADSKWIKTLSALHQTQVSSPAHELQRTAVEPYSDQSTATQQAQRPGMESLHMMLNRRLIQKRLSFLSAWTTANTFQILLRNSLNNGWEDL